MGLFVATRAWAPAPGDRLPLLVRFQADRSWREVQVEVRWSRAEGDATGRPGFGAAFVFLDPMARAELRSHLARRQLAACVGAGRAAL